MKQKLKPSERKFIELVGQAAYINPFTDTRHQIDCKILGIDPKLGIEPHPEDVVVKLTGFLAKLEDQGISSSEDVDNIDKPSMEYLYLFEIYHIYRIQFDELIQNQLKKVGNSCKVAFGDEVIQKLLSRGFSDDEAVKMMGVFFQMRRAFYFIENNLSGASASMQQLRIRLWNNIFTHDIRWYNTSLINRMEDFSTLLLGETGTGKGMVAQAIGRSGFIPYDRPKQQYSQSFNDIFVQINLSQFSDALIESELFGHAKGAFTGALEEHKGIFDLSSPYGSIFLDEIGEVSTTLQIKLLKILQEREFTPVGSHQKHRFAGRVIAATNKKIEQLRDIFRDDFYYRLCSDVVVVPTLQQRINENKSELLFLVRSVLNRLTGENSPKLIEMVYESILQSPSINYNWPGNVRELEQCIRRILLYKSYQVDSQQPDDLQSQIIMKIKNGEYDANSLLTDYCRMLYQRHPSYQEVAKITGLDRRTVKKYIDSN